MGKRLTENINSQYIQASNLLRPKKARKKIVAYVESYDDIFFWRTLLSEFENNDFYFQVMLPSSNTLAKGKKPALMNQLGKSLGDNMIACVDADYDYLLQGASNTSRHVIRGKYVFHTYAYAIENYRCYAESLHKVCVMATLNDRQIIDFSEFMKLYSQIVYPLFIWSIWVYRKHILNTFSITDLSNITRIDQIKLNHPEEVLNDLSRKVNRKIQWFERRYPRALNDIKAMRKELTQLGVTPDNTYMFIQGHHIMDNVVMKLLTPVCAQLRREREYEIKKLAGHNTQMQNELTAYQNSQAGVDFMLRKNTEYKDAPLYQLIRNDIKDFLEKIKEHNESKEQEAFL